MAKPKKSRKAAAQNVPESVRDAVQRTVNATVGSVDEVVRRSQVTRGRAEKAIDELMSAFEDRLPASHDEVKRLSKEVADLKKRVAALEKRVPKKAVRSSAASGTAKRQPR